jgi:ribonuclease PH
MRAFARPFNQVRPISLDPYFSKHPEGSCLASFGDTRVLCTASVEERVPHFMKNTGTGWITAEYGMLPRSTHTRTDREASRGKQSGRTHEIQRLIGRSLRAVTDLAALGERQIRIDCDVLQADGGTRTTAITGAYVALHFALLKLKEKQLIRVFPLKAQVAALSVGVVDGVFLADLDYAEDSRADIDANFVFTSEDQLVEVQACGEKRAFLEREFQEMLDLAREGAVEIFQHQKKILEA